MFTTLVESRAKRPRRAAGTIASIGMHGALIATIVAVTMPGSGDASETQIAFDPPPTYVIVRPRQVPSAPAPAAPATGLASPLPSTIIIPPSSIPTSIPTIDVSIPSVPAEQIGIRAAGGPIGSSQLGVTSHGLGGDGVVDVRDAERIPAVLGNPAAPLYPNALRASGVSGRVEARFVIDTTGRVELDGLAMESWHPLFSDAVRSALSRFRFSPGEAGGRKVRTMVQMPFVFTLR